METSDGYDTISDTGVDIITTIIFFLLMYRVFLMYSFHADSYVKWKRVPTHWRIQGGGGNPALTLLKTTEGGSMSSPKRHECDHEWEGHQ